MVGDEFENIEGFGGGCRFVEQNPSESETLMGDDGVAADGSGEECVDFSVTENDERSVFKSVGMIFHIVPVVEECGVFGIPHKCVPLIVEGGMIRQYGKIGMLGHYGQSLSELLTKSKKSR